MRKLLTLVTILSLATIMSFANAKELPELGRPSARVLSPAQEQQLGIAVMQQIQQQMPLVHDPLINNYLQTLGTRLLANTGSLPFEFHFFVVKQLTINAFSAPGGYIGVNAGLILTTASEAELASVLAHEIAHVTQHHIARSIARQKELALPMAAAMIAAAVLGATAGGDAAAGMMQAGMGGSSQHMINFIRANEKEADRIGMQKLHHAGFDPAAMPKFLERMQRENMDYGGKMPEYLRTHPFTTSRIADTQNRLKNYQAKPRRANPDYYLMRARLQVIMTRKAATAVKYFQNSRSPSGRYGYALALMQNKHYRHATTIVKKLLKHEPHQVIYQMAAAEIQTEQHHSKQALQILQNAYEFHPDFYPLIVDYAAALIKARKFRQAAKFIDQQLEEYPDNIILYSLLSKAEGKAGNLAAAYQARAEVFELYHNPKMAVMQLEQALKQPNLPHHTKAIIQAEIAKLKQSK